MVIIYFISGSVFTIVLLIVGLVVGYWIGSKQLEKKVQEISRRVEVRRTPKDKSGPIKAITPKEVALEREKSFVEKLQGYVEPDRPLV